MITDIDRKTIDHIENYGFCTIGQARDMFYNVQKFGYDICRKRMAKLIAGEYLKEFRNMDTNEKVFYNPKNPIKKISLHSMLIMNYYAKLLGAGVDIKYFKREKQWLNGDIRSDGLCVFEFGDFSFYQIIEVHLSHNNLNIGRYEKLYNSQEAHKLCNGHFPTIIIISNQIYAEEIKIPNIKTIKIDFELKEFNKIFL